MHVLEIRDLTYIYKIQYLNTGQILNGRKYLSGLWLICVFGPDFKQTFENRTTVTGIQMESKKVLTIQKLPETLEN